MNGPDTSFSTSSSSSSSANANPASPASAPARSVALAPDSGPAVPHDEVVSTAQKDSRRFPLMGIGALPDAPLPDDHPQVVAARASNDGTATLDTSRAQPPQ